MNRNNRVAALSSKCIISSGPRSPSFFLQSVFSFSLLVHLLPWRYLRPRLFGAQHVPCMAKASSEQTPLLVQDDRGHSTVLSEPLVSATRDDVSFLTPAILPVASFESEASAISTACPSYRTFSEDGDRKSIAGSDAESSLGTGSTSPYLGGLDKIGFWLVFGGICLNTFVRSMAPSILSLLCYRDIDLTGRDEQLPNAGIDCPLRCDTQVFYHLEPLCPC